MFGHLQIILLGLKKALLPCMKAPLPSLRSACQSPMQLSSDKLVNISLVLSSDQQRVFSNVVTIGITNRVHALL